MAGSLPRIIVLITVLLSCLAGRSATAAADRESLAVGDTTRTFHLHVPPKHRSGAPIPLVIALHGGGSNGAAMERFSGLSDTADRNGFLVLYPDGSGRLPKFLTWNAGSCCGYAQTHAVDDVAFVSRLVDLAIRRDGADPSRVYVTGISNGAMMAYRLAAEIPQRIAAIAAVSGTLAVEPAAIRAPMPILHFHGTNDQFVPYEGGRGPRSLTAGPHTSVSKTIDTWVRVNQVRQEPAVAELPGRPGDPTRVVRYTYGTHTDSQNIVLYKIIGGGHSWPGRPKLEHLLGKSTTVISANEIMWAFFQAHTKPTSALANMPGSSPRDLARLSISAQALGLASAMRRE